MAKVIVTGINGFVGYHLAKELNSSGTEVVGVGREEKPSSKVSAFLAGYARSDLTNNDEVAAIPLEEVKAIINLAGLARVGDSFSDPERYNHVNVAVLALIGERLIQQSSKVRMIAVSTGAVYDPHQDLPLTEDSKITLDNSPYALSKIKMEEAADELRGKGLDCVIVRPFNHIGPGQEPGFLVPDLYQKISSSLETGQPVEVGNLRTRRDYTDVRDVVKAYAGLALAGELSHDLYNVCSSKSIAGEEILDTLIDLMNAKGKIETKVNPKFIRASDPWELYGSNQRLHSETGWSPSFNLSQTLSDFVNQH